MADFKKELLELALKRGCDAAEVYCSKSENFDVNIRNGEIDEYSVSGNASISLRVVYKGHDGFASTESFDDAETLVKRAMDNAQTVDSEDEHPMQGKSEYRELKSPDSQLRHMSERERIDRAFEFEKLALASDKRVKRTERCRISCSESCIELLNTCGLDASYTSGSTMAIVGVVMEENGEEKSGYAFGFDKKTDDLKALVDEAVKNCAATFGASPVPSGKYKILFKNKTFCDMLELFGGVFSAYAAQKGLSKLAGREGDIIASECVTLCDDPFNEVCPIPFDSEGVPTMYKNVIENGKLVTLLHSLKTAKTAGCASTGNGTRTGACSNTNLYIKPGEKSFEELLQGERVLVISSVEGAGTGVNEVSGEFSLSASGELYENGRRVKSVNQITVAGSFFDLLKNIEAVGSDLEFASPSGMGFMGSPSVLVKELMISG